MVIKEEQKEKEEISGKETTEQDAFGQKAMNIFSKHFDIISWPQTIVLFIFGFTVITLLIHSVIILKDLKKELRIIESYHSRFPDENNGLNAENNLLKPNELRKQSDYLESHLVTAH